MIFSSPRGEKAVIRRKRTKKWDWQIMQFLIKFFFFFNSEFLDWISGGEMISGGFLGLVHETYDGGASRGAGRIKSWAHKWKHKNTCINWWAPWWGHGIAAHVWKRLRCLLPTCSQAALMLVCNASIYQFVSWICVLDIRSLGESCGCIRKLYHGALVVPLPLFTSESIGFCLANYVANGLQAYRKFN